MPVSDPAVADRPTGEPVRRRPSTPVERPRLAGLDGLRGLAVLAVVAYHFDALRGGFLGVDLFFVVSGFLITRMMIVRRAGGRRVTLGWFWRRRLRRLLPAVLVLVVAVVVVVERLDGGAFAARTRGQGLSGLLYVNNWYDLRAHIGYFDVALDKTPLNHLWSLSIEEQFYVVWPVMFIAFARSRRGFNALMGITAVLIVVSMALAPFWLARDGWARAYLGTDSRVGAILLGALLSLVLTRHELLRTRWRAASRWCVRVACLAAAVFLAVQWRSAEVTSDAVYRGGLAACSLAAAVLVAGVAIDGDGVGSLFGRRPIAWVGRLSYSLYLWHVPIIVLVNENRTGLSGVRLFAVQLGLIVVTTLASYYLVEQPIHLEGFSVNRALLAGATGMVCVVVVLGLPDLVPTGATNRTLVSTARPRSFTPAEVQALDVLIVGDSWGIRTGLGMNQMPDPRPKQVRRLAQPSCGIADPVEETGMNGATFTPTDECLAWRTTWTEAMRQQPSFVILQVGNWDQARKRLTPDGDWVTACDPEFRVRYNERLDQAIAILTAGATPVFVTTVRDNEDVLRPRSDCINSMLRGAVARHATEGVHLLDLQELLCPGHDCAVSIDGRPTYDDTGHIDLGTLEAVNRWIFAELGAVLGTQVPATDLWAGKEATPLVTVPRDEVGVRDFSSVVRDLEAAAGALAGPNATGQPAPDPTAAAEILSSVGAIAARADYPSLVEQLAAGTDDAAFRVDPASGGTTSAVATFSYGADEEADRAAVTLRRLVVEAGAAVTLDNDNLQHFTLDDTTVSFRRSWQRLSVTVITGGETEPRMDLARAALKRLP